MRDCAGSAVLSLAKTHVSTSSIWIDGEKWNQAYNVVTIFVYLLPRPETQLWPVLKDKCEQYYDDCTCENAHSAK